MTFAGRSATARRGTVSLESLFGVALILAVILGAVGVADLLIAEQSLAEASGRAARAAALGGGDREIEAAVRAVIGPDRAEHARIAVHPRRAARPGELIEVRVELAARHALATPFAPVSRNEPLVGRTVMQRE